MKTTIHKAMSSLTAKLAALLFAFTCAGTAWGATLTVPGDYGTITDAFNAASAGDTIQLTADVNYPRSNFKTATWFLLLQVAETRSLALAHMPPVGIRLLSLM